MYGSDDIYGSPITDDFGGDDLAQIDAYLDDDEEEEDDEGFGALGHGILGRGSLLGIALGKKGKENRLLNILGNLKKYFEKENKKQAKKYAKALSRVDLVKEGKKAYDKDFVTPEVQAWLDYAETEDWGALTEALEAISWTGDNLEDGDDAVEEGEVYTAAGGAGRSHKGRGRKLPPGFRPRGYSTWKAGHKSHWLSRHPRAASVRLPIDPGPMPGRQGHGRPGRPARPVRPVRPPPRFSPRSAPRSAPRPTAHPAVRPTAPSSVRPSPSFKTQAARAAGRQFVRSRFGLDEAIAEGVEEFGALIGPDAFLPLQGRDFLGHSTLFDDEDDDELDGLDADDDPSAPELKRMWDEDDDEFGAYIAAFGEDDDDDDDEFGARRGHRRGPRRSHSSNFGAYIPQFGAMFKRDIEDRLEAARRRYERLRAKETDQTKVAEAYTDYQRLVRAYAAASRLPTAERKGPSLARELGASAASPSPSGDYTAPEEQTFRLRGRVAQDEDDDLGDDQDFQLGAPA